jgi:hypothetical protein
MVKFLNTMVSRCVGIALIAMTFFYFLIFAQFGFLHLIEARVGSGSLNRVLGVMGIAGVVGAMWTAFKYKPKWSRVWLICGFLGSGAGSWIAAFGRNQFTFIIAAGITGIYLGMLTVSLVGVLARIFPMKGAGLLCGVGVGLAYFLSNVPFVFNATPIEQTLFAYGACGIGFLLSIFMDLSSTDNSINMGVKCGRGSSVLSLSAIVTVFFVLVWTDSAAFNLIQKNDALKATSWAGKPHLWLIALTHFAAAISGGYWMDKGRICSLFVFSFAGLMGGALLLYSGHFLFLFTLIYVSAVSLYSTALVAFALVAPCRVSCFSPACQAGFVFAIGGWIGSAMGIGMVSDLGRIPSVYWVVAAPALLFGFLGLSVFQKRVTV